MSTDVRPEQSAFDSLRDQVNTDDYTKQTQEMDFESYLNMVYQKPELAQSAYQRMFRMIVAPGTEKVTVAGQTITHYKFFHNHDPVFGIDESLQDFVKTIRGAASHLGPSKRLLLLHGPVGSAKSTICSNLKRGLEDYTASDEGAVYTYYWKDLPENIKKDFDEDELDCPLYQDPLTLLPKEIRQQIEIKLNQTVQENIRRKTKEAEDAGIEYDNIVDDLSIKINDLELNPFCQWIMDALMEQYGGDWGEVIANHIQVRRYVFSEIRRVGIGTFQPKDEKNQDSTELNGDINYRQLGRIGKDSDPRAFNFDGEFLISNRGCMEFIEVLKLAVEFLYDLLSVTQERKVKPKKFSQIKVDIALLGHTNGPEYERLQGNEYMTALQDRTIRIDVPYTTEWSSEQKILEKDFSEKTTNRHIAPHTIEMAALFDVLTRLTEDNECKNIVDKVRLYDKSHVEGFNEYIVKEMRQRAYSALGKPEGMDGISPRFTQDCMSQCLVSNHEYVNPFMLMDQLRRNLETSTRVSDKIIREKYLSLIDVVQDTYDEIIKEEISEVLVMDNDVLQRMFLKYLDHANASLQKTKIEDTFKGIQVPPDEQFMRNIEEKVDIVDRYAFDFRNQVLQFVGNLALEHGKKKEELRWDCMPELSKALKRKRFNDAQSSIKLSALTKLNEGIDEDEQAKIDVVKQRLIKELGYNEKSASDILHYVSGIFARGRTEN